MRRERWFTGNQFGLAIPADPAALRYGGPRFLTDAFRTSGVLAGDSSVTDITELFSRDFDNPTRDREKTQREPDEVAAEGYRDDYDQQGPAPFPCADGFVYLDMTSRAHWLGVKALVGHPEWLDAFDDAAQIARGAPDLGEDTDVLHEILRAGSPSEAAGSRTTGGT
jgi:hypothetical protein